jgi:S-adenosyl-L-methionine hydrolase (adenosine-forming)
MGMLSIVTLTTDFEEHDPFVASTKGVLYTHCPGVQIIDLSHQIHRQSVREGALFIAGAVPFFPEGTIHIVAVDSGARPLAVSLNRQFIICPDNGLLTLLMEQYELDDARAITNPKLNLAEDSQTYFARDVFAPAAAMLARGGSLGDMGDRIEKVAKLNFPRAIKENDRLVSGRTIHVNRYGSLVTNIHKSVLRGSTVNEVRIGGFPVGPLLESYSQVKVGFPLALIGSSGYLEIAYHGDRADTRLNLGVDILVTVAIKPSAA